jgi:hypothetical protein
MRLKSELYDDEQNFIIDKIISILGITVENNTITLYEIDTNETIKQQLMELIPEIRKWFSFGHILPISNPDKYVRPYMSIVRQIPKKKWIISHNKDFRIYKDDTIIRTQQYTFNSKTT